MVDIKKPLNSFDLRGKKFSAGANGNPVIRSKSTGRFSSWVSKAGETVKSVASSIPVVNRIPGISRQERRQTALRTKEEAEEVAIGRQKLKAAKIQTEEEKEEAKQRKEMNAYKLSQLKYEKRHRTAIFDRDAFVRSAKRHALFLAIIFFGSLPFIAFAYISFTSHTYAFSYQQESFYGPILSQLWSYTIGPLWSAIVNINACNEFGYISNYAVCSGTQNVNKTVVVYRTFTSFITATPAQNPLTVFMSQAKDNPGQLFYSVTNNANVPLGSSTSNHLLVNTSCGGSNAGYSADVYICKGTTNLSNNLPASYNTPLVPSVYPSETIENQTQVLVSCPVNTLKIQLPSFADMLLNFTIQNYSAASVFPVEFIDSAFDQQLFASQQGLIPSAPSVTFVSPGPLQVSFSTSEPQPIITNGGNVPINLAIANNGPGRYVINKFIIFVPKSLWPNESQAYPSCTPSSQQSCAAWSCVDAANIPHPIAMNFVFPTSGYWACTSTITSSAIASAGTQIVLDNVPGLAGMHFNTVPILAYINYNYIQQMDMIFKPFPQGFTCP